VSPDNSQDIVTAVIVAHDGASWIASVAHAVASQSRPVQRVVAVDTGSRDRSGAMLTQAFGRGAVFGMERGAGYGFAVNQALRHRAANSHVPSASPGASQERNEWVWLIHDDCEPAPDTLEKLLLGARRTPASAVLGPKVRDWTDRDVLLESGLTIDRAGRRITGIEPREVDQGQHDGDRDVVAVSTAGMLIRRDVWDEVGGFDPGMKLFREDVDFCWRVQAAGYRVRLITDAVVYHVEASVRNRRPTSAAPRRRREDRRNGLTTLAGNLPARPMLAALAGNLVLSTLRTLFFLLAKRPAAALDEAAAFCSVACHPIRLRTARRRRARGRQSAYSRLRTELPPSRSLHKLAEFVTGALSKSLPVDTVGSHHAATEDPSDDDFLLTDSGLVQRLLTNPGVLLFLALTIVALVAERSLLASTPLGGGALVPAWGGVSGLWHEYFQGFHPAGIGTAASTPPYVAAIAVLATVLGGKPWLAVDVILLGCVPLAGLTAYLAAGRITRFVPARVWAAATYALLPVGMGAVAAGRLGTAVVLVLAPLAALLAGRSFTGPRRRARRAAWATALVVTLAAAFVPLVWLIAAAAMLMAALVFRRRGGAGVLNAAIVVGIPLLLLMPWTATLVSHPAQFFLEAGMTKPGLASPALAARSLLLLSPGGPGLPPFWVTGGVLLAAAVALVASGRRALVLAGWGVALIGLIAAAVVSRVAVTPPDAPTPVPAWPGVALAIAGVGLLLAAVAAAERMPGVLGSGRWRTMRGLAVLLVAVVACSAPLLAAAKWVMTGVNGPVAPAAGPLLPEFVSVSSDSGPRVRTLIVQGGPRGSITYTVLRSSDPLIGSGELAMPIAGQSALDRTVAALTAANGGDIQDQGQSLAGFGIGYVMLPAPVDANLARLLDDVPGLRPVSVTSAFQLWRVVTTVARVTVTEPNGTVAAIPSGTVSVSGAKAPTAGGTLVLAEPAGGWHATLNGHPLTPLASPVNGWAQGFKLPAGGGSLSVSRSDLGRTVAVLAEGLAVLVVLALGLPGAKEAEETSEQGRRGSARRGTGRGRGAERSRDRRAPRRARPDPDAVPDDDDDEELAGDGVPEPAVAGETLAGAGMAAGTLRGAAAAGEAAGRAGARRPGPPSQGRSRLRSAMPSGVRSGLLRRGGPATADDPREGGRHGGDGGYEPEDLDARPGQQDSYGRPGSYAGDDGYGDEGRGAGRGRRGYQGARRAAAPDDATAYLGGGARGAGPAGPGGPQGPPPGRRGRRGYDPAPGQEEPGSGPGTGPQRPAGYRAPGPGGPPGYGEDSGEGGFGSRGRTDPGDPRGRAPAGRRRRGAPPPAPAGGEYGTGDYGPAGDYGPGRGDAGAGGRGYDPGPGRRGRDYDTGTGDYGPGPGGSSPGREPGPRYDTGPHSTGPQGRERYDTGPHSTGPQRASQHEAGRYDSGPYDTGPHPTGPHPTGPHPTGPHPTGPRDPGPRYEPGPGYDTGPGYDAGPGRGYDTGPAGGGYDAGPGRRGRGDSGYGTGPAGDYDTGPHGGRGYDTGPGPAAERGRRARGYDDDYDAGPGAAGRGGPGPAGGYRDQDSAGYGDAENYGPPSGYGAPPGGRGRPPAGPPPPGEGRGRGAPRQSAGRGGGRRRGGWLGRGSGSSQDERGSRRAPYGPPRSQDGALSPLPPLPPRRHRSDDDYDPADGPPSDWGQEQPDEGDQDW
jgi:GT2 family glycosyltransferase